MQEVRPSFSSYASFDFAESKSQDLGVSNETNINIKEDESEEEDGFEFETHEALTISADEIFLDGKIRSIPPQPLHPLVYGHSEAKSTRNMLGKFLEEERISEANENIDPGTFCEWKPKPENGRKKSSSTNTSRRWKLRDLIRRSTSDGGEHMMAGKEALPVKSAHEIHYTKNRAMKEADKRRSFLPYRKDIVGLFGNVNGFSKALKPVLG